MRILIGYPRIENANAPAIAVGILTSLFKGNELSLFDSFRYVSNQNTGINKRSKLGAGKLVEHDIVLKPREEFIPDWVEHVKQFKPELILLSCTEDTIGLGRDMLRAVQAFNIPNIVGGIFAKTAPELCLSYPEVDSISTSDADINITPDYSLYELDQFDRPLGGKIIKAIPIETMRGCPYTCAYCCSGKKSKLVYKDLVALEEELERHVELVNPDWWFINDDSFLSRSVKDLESLMQVFAKFNMKFWCNTRFDDVTTEKLELLKYGGIGRFNFGLEHGNEEYRTTGLNRPISNKKILEKAALVNESNIPYGLNVMLGFPLETRDMVFDTIRLLKAIRGYDAIGVASLVPYRGTQLRPLCLDLGLINEDFISNGGFLTTPALDQKPPYLSRKEIIELRELFKFYAFYDEDLWEDITLDSLDFWEDKYNTEFYSDLPLGGKQHILRRNNNEAIKRNI